MSFKYQAQKVTDNHYVLPKIGEMRTEVHAYLSQRLYDISEEGLWNQAQAAACHPGVNGVYLMPDTHVGYVVPVGGVVVTDDVILQAGSGYDISCGVIYLKVPDLQAQDVAGWDKRDSWVRAVQKRIAMGVGRGQSVANYSEKDLQEILRYGAKALGVKADLCERQYIPIDPGVDLKRIEKAYEKALPQLGSVGGGNHFIEMQVDEKDGSVWVMIHCGSRGFGYQTAEHYFKAGALHRGLSQNRREESWLRVDEPLGKEYWAAHNAAANYAIANRHVIVEGVQEALRKIFKAEGELYYEISHNLVQQETLVLPDGSTKRGFVHRKGATRAFPAGHPDLVGTRWAETGHPCLIPGSMYDGAAILFPEPGAYKTACSVNHGSGRRLGRKDAIRKLKHKQEWIDDQMRNVKRKLGGAEIRGIVGNNNKTPLDECGEVYKDLDDVLEVLEEEGIARVAHRMYPVANLKGSD